MHSMQLRALLFHKGEPTMTKKIPLCFKAIKIMYPEQQRVQHH